ncbi:hypothetical protein KSF73_14660 [Burkholderiaceae bacterium DAT-1]|nr:hypothetical protein [Burkholderiaceae bacterium DAT-1]
MRQILDDALDFSAFRFRSLDHYVYPAWQPLLWLAAIATVNALGAGELRADVVDRTVFFIVLYLLSTSAAALFFQRFCRASHRWREPGSLFPLMVLVSSIEIFQPLGALLPYDAGFILSLMLLGYQLVLLARGLQASTGLPMPYITKGVLLFIPIMLAIILLASAIIDLAGWIPAPFDGQAGGGM